MAFALVEAVAGWWSCSLARLTEMLAQRYRIEHVTLPEPARRIIRFAVRDSQN